MSSALEGVLLDVGGVLLLPDGLRLAGVLDASAITYSPAFERAHYLAIRAFDTQRDPADPWGSYVHGYIRALEVPETDHERAFEHLRPVWRSSSIELWCAVVTESVTGLLALSQRGLHLGIISNSDGSAEEQLRRHRICEVGGGPCVPVSVIVDSAVVGVSKPDPEIFECALDPLGLSPEKVAYVGDSVANDVEGARRAGVAPFHFDPLGLCDDGSHEHLARVADILDRT